MSLKNSASFSSNRQSLQSDSSFGPFEVIDMGGGKVGVNQGVIINKSGTFYIDSDDFLSPAKPQNLLSGPVVGAQLLTVQNNGFVCILISPKATEDPAKHEYEARLVYRSPADLQGESGQVIKLAKIRSIDSSSPGQAIDVENLYVGNIIINEGSYHAYQVIVDSGVQKVYVANGSVAATMLCGDEVVTEPMIPYIGDGGETESGGFMGSWGFGGFDTSSSYGVYVKFDFRGAVVEIVENDEELELKDCERAFQVARFKLKNASSGGGLVADYITQYWHSDVYSMFEKFNESEGGCCNSNDDSGGSDDGSDDSSGGGDGSSGDSDGDSGDSEGSEGSEGDSSDDDSDDDSSRECDDLLVMSNLRVVDENYYGFGWSGKCFDDPSASSAQGSIEVVVDYAPLCTNCAKHTYVEITCSGLGTKRQVVPIGSFGGVPGGMTPGGFIKVKFDFSLIFPCTDYVIRAVFYLVNGPNLDTQFPCEAESPDPDDFVYESLMKTISWKSRGYCGDGIDCESGVDSLVSDEDEEDLPWA